MRNGESEYSVYGIRHSKAEYRSNKAIIASEHPDDPFDPEQQLIPDLTEEGRQLAEREAETFFRQFDPSATELFFVSSKMVRALETANIYRKVAERLGFSVVEPEHVRSKTAQTVGEGKIRDVKNLSISVANMLAQYVFTPEHQLPPIRWETVSDELRQRWQKARAMIEKHEYGSWGENYHHYSETVKAIFPELTTSQELYHGQFQNLLHLVRFAEEKIRLRGSKKQLKVLAFGHENYASVALEKYFGEHALGNCEVIALATAGNAFRMKAKGREAIIESEHPS